MNFVVMVGAGIGIVLIYLGFTAPPGRSVAWGKVERLGRDAGRPSLRAHHIVLSSFGAGLASVVVAALFTNSLIVCAIAVLAGGWAPIGWLRSRVRRRRKAHREVWPETIALITSGVRAGMSLPEVVAGLSERGPEALRPYFQRYRATYRALSSFEASLTALADDLSDPIADRVISALKLANEVGGTDLVRVLRALGDFVREDLRVRKEIEARWAWTVTAARLAAAAPWLVLVVMSSRPEAAAAYDSPTGMMLVVGGAVATFAGYRSMLRAARLPEQPRWRP